MLRFVRQRRPQIQQTGNRLFSSTSDPLLQPFQIRGLKLKNRILSTAHAPAYATKDGMPGERYIRYHEEKAKGGLALTMFGGSSCVDVDSPPVFGQLDVGTDDVIPHFQNLAVRVKSYGTSVMCQITHGGRRTTWEGGNWLSTVAPSRVREPAHRGTPKEMDLWDIERIVNAYAEAARRCKLGELDGCELLCAGHLVDQFWSLSTNHRTDGYGGSLENRARFGIEVLEAMRKQVGPDFLLGMRFSASEFTLHSDDKGLSHEDMIKIAQIYDKTGLVDFMNVVAGEVSTHAGVAKLVPNMATPLAPYVDWAANIKKNVSVPIFHASRLMDPSTARNAIREGLIDMVGMTRAHMADPYIVHKLETGQEDRIRLCVGAGYCIDRIYKGGEALCIQNPATGREFLGIPHVIFPTSPEKQKTVVVVGGGPAGLEAARVCASRGHRTILFEASNTLGGQVLLARRAGWRKDIGGIVDWLANEVRVLGVEVRLGAFATGEDVLALSPNVVVVATGGIPDNSRVALGGRGLGIELAESTWDVLGGSAKPFKKGDVVVVYDDLGQHQGVSCADFIARKGKDDGLDLKVKLLTPDRCVAEEMGSSNFSEHLKNLYLLGVDMVTDHRLVEIRPQANSVNAFDLFLRNEFTLLEHSFAANRVIVEHGTLPETSLFNDLASHSSNLGETDLKALVQNLPQTRVRNPHGKFQLFRVGDAISSRNIHAALYDSLRLCKDI